MGVPLHLRILLILPRIIIIKSSRFVHWYITKEVNIDVTVLHKPQLLNALSCALRVVISSWHTSKDFSPFQESILNFFLFLENILTN